MVDRYYFYFGAHVPSCQHMHQNYAPVFAVDVVYLCVISQLP